MKLLKMAVIVMAVAGLCSISYAGWKDKLKAPAPAGDSAVDVKGMKTKLDKSVLEIGLARKLLLDAQVELASALDIKEEVDKILSAKNISVSGGVVDQAKNVGDIENQIKVSEELSAKINAAAENAGPLSDKGKKHFKKGQAAFGKGLVAEGAQVAIIVALASEISNQASQAKSNPMAAGKLAAMAAPAAKLASLLPGDVNAGIKTYGLIKKIGKDNNIKVEEIDTDSLLTGAE